MLGTNIKDNMFGKVYYTPFEDIAVAYINEIPETNEDVHRYWEYVTTCKNLLVNSHIRFDERREVEWMKKHFRKTELTNKLKT